MPQPAAVANNLAAPGDVVRDLAALTPVERRGAYWFKRDDLFEVAGTRGGKARTCAVLARGARGLVTAGSRQSPQVNIVAHLARELGVPCRAHTPTGKLSAELESARSAGAEIVQHRAGYNNVIISRARADAEKRGWTNIPFGMECFEAVEQSALQVRNLPWGKFSRIIVTAGSGMSLAGILYGLLAANRCVPVLGVCVGADPAPRLNRYGPALWRSMTQLVKAGIDYRVEAKETQVERIELDPIYEAKCLRFLQPGHLFWVVGIRKTALEGSDDSCPF